jgi:hypothetical protein
MLTTVRQGAPLDMLCNLSLSSFCALPNWFDENFCWTEALPWFHWPTFSLVLVQINASNLSCETFSLQKKLKKYE